MRRFALPIVICLASYGCAASEESDPAPSGNHNNTGGALNVAGSTGNSGSGTTAGSSPGTGGSSTSNGGSGTQPSGGSTPTAGSTGSAGTTAAGGAPPGGGTCMMTASAMGTTPLIDDFEDGNADVMMNEGRVGGWYLATDKTGTTTPKDGPAMPEAGGMPGKAVHVSGSGLTSWGASLAASITPMNGCYDASKFTGVTVSLKGTGSVWVSVLTAAVRGAPEGMRNHYKKQVVLTGEWTTITISFTELMQPGGWGVIVPFDATKIYGIDFGPATAPPAATAFDFWVDNLSFKM